MTTGRPRPAYIEIPEDVLAEEGEAEITPVTHPTRQAACGQAVTDAAQWLKEAERPLVCAGGGVIWSAATSELTRLAEEIGAPVATTCNGKGALPDDHPQALGYVNFSSTLFSALWQRADVVLAVGTGFDEITTAGFTLPAPQKLIQIDVDAAQVGRNYPVAAGLVGDAAVVLNQLATALDGPAPAAPSAWLEEATALRHQVRELADGQDGLRLVDAMTAALGRNGITTGDAAGVGIWQLWHQPTYEPHTFLFPLGFGTLGFGLPAALGAQVVHPDRRVICLCGDGGFLFTGQELATAVQHSLNVVTVIVNDNAYGAIRHLQERLYQGRIIAADLVNPDFVRYAEAFGAFGLRTEKLEELPKALESAFSSGKPALIEVPGPISRPPGV
jgi:acetolactate synthase-1/2/3 large subunit